jgi:hypothetical protein
MTAITAVAAVVPSKNMPTEGCRDMVIVFYREETKMS